MIMTILTEPRIFEHVGINLGYDDIEAETTSSGRKYKCPNGVSYPSVTTVLSILSEDGIRAWRKRVGEVEANKISHRAATRGTAVHAIVEDLSIINQTILKAICLML